VNSIPNLEAVFVYGTLRKRENPTHFIKGYCLYAVKGVSFPAITESHVDNVVYGELLPLEYDEHLESLDAYEGVHYGLYKREKVAVYSVTDSKLVGCYWAYIFYKDEELDIGIDSGDWMAYARA